MFVFEPVKRGEGNPQYDRTELALEKTVHEEFRCVCAGGGQLSTESTRLQPPLSCYHSNLSSGHPPNIHPASHQDNDTTNGRSVERDKRQKKNRNMDS